MGYNPPSPSWRGGKGVRKNKKSYIYKTRNQPALRLTLSAIQKTTRFALDAMRYAKKLIQVFEIKTDKDNLVVEKLTAQFGQMIEGHELVRDMLCITVNKQAIIETLAFLRDDNELQYNFLTTLCGMHYPEKKQLGVVYHLHSFTNNHRIRIKTALEIEHPVIETATTLWPAANWMERETYDFFGIEFEGHPNLVRILNTDDFEGFPLRKEFPLEDQTREDKDNSMFGR